MRPLHYPFLNLFLVFLFLSTIIALSSSHWLMVWVALELNIISFLPIITASSHFQESESALKYFFFQALGSSALLLGSVNHPLSMLIIAGLVFKLGAAPFHFWFPTTTAGLPWPAVTLLITWQKLAPISLLIFSWSHLQSILLTLGLLGAVVGGLGGIAQTRLRPLLAYSSIGHMGWILAASSASPLLGMLYFIFYLVISSPLLVSLFISNTQLTRPSDLPLSHTTMIITAPCTLSLSGLPPLTGILPKILALTALSSILPAIILITGSIINLRYYLNFFISTLVSSPIQKYSLRRPTPLPLLLLTCIACLPLPSLLLLTLFL